MNTLPAQPFFSTPQQRLALARQRYFEDGVRPSGLVSEPVIQSWSRCVQGRRDPVERIAFNPVTPSRVHSALARSRLLLDAAAADLAQLEHSLAGTACTAILTDPHGVVVHSTRPSSDGDGGLVRLARRIGVSLDEEHVGTAAPGVTLRTGQPCAVLGAEHFFGHLQHLHCAAAPIHDIHGRIAAVLDVTGEHRGFGFDAGAVVALYATTIENRLLRAQSDEHLVLHLQTSPALLGTPLEGLAGVDGRGRLAWVNPMAARLLGIGGARPGQAADALFGLDATALTRLSRAGAAEAHRLPSGLVVWIAARLQASDGAARLHAVGRTDRPASASASAPASTAWPLSAPGATPLPATLRERDHHLIARTVQACGGNVSQAARALGVSRGLVYRHLKQAEPSRAAPVG